jgi:hypothetical protein
MRIHPVLAAAALAGGLLAALTGCAGSGGTTAGTTSPPASHAVDPAALAGPTWVVHGGGAADGAHVRFDDRAITVTDDGRTSTLAWAAQGDALLATRSTIALNGPVPTDWLTGAARIAPTADGWRLLAADGSTTASLTALAGAPSAAPTPAPSALAPVTPGPGVRDVPADAIAGRWILAGRPRTAITFTDGTWRATASCETGTPGGAGAYRVLAGGHLLVTRSVALRFGCPVIGSEPRLRAPAISGIARAATFRIEGDTLTVYDRTGAAIGSLVRGAAASATVVPSPPLRTGAPPSR